MATYNSVGVIFGEAGTYDFKFLISDSTSVHRNEYIKAWHETDGWVLSQVVSITRSSDSYSFEEAKHKKRTDKEKSGDKIIAEATVIGTRNKLGLLKSPTIPFRPGDPIYKADNDLICNVLGLSGDDMYLGYLDGTSIPVKLGVNSLVQKHCSILAKTGSGKSYTAGVILEELLDKNIPLLILDPHGEYHSLKNCAESNSSFKRYMISPKGYESSVTVYTPANRVINPSADETFRLNELNLSVEDLSTIFENISSTHSGILYEAIDKLKAEMEHYTLDDIIFEVKNDKSKAKWHVSRLLEELKNSDLLSTNPTHIKDLFRKGKASIIDFKGVSPDMQNMIVATLCKKLFEARKLNKIPPGMVIIEEAHNFAPERGFSKTASSEIIRTVASEGRKFGLGLMVISQRPARIDKNVLSQCGTQIIMKVTNPNDLKSISKGLEGVNSSVEDELMRLPPGVAMIVSNDIERPILVDIRVKKSEHGGESVNVLKYASDSTLEYEQSIVVDAPFRTQPEPIAQSNVPGMQSDMAIDENRKLNHRAENNDGDALNNGVQINPIPKRTPSRKIEHKKKKSGLFDKMFGSNK